MGVRLMVEVLNHAPPSIGPTERLLLLALAEKADDQTRLVRWARGENPREVLRQRINVSEGAVRKAFGRLADVGLDPRVPIGTDRGGHAMYAHSGRAAEYSLPVLDPTIGVPLFPPSPAESRDETVTIKTRTEGHLSGTTFPPSEPERREDSTALVPLSLSPDAREAARALVRQHGLDEDAAERIAVACEVKHKPRDLARYVSRIPLAELRRLDTGARRPTPKVDGPRCPGGTRWAADGTCLCNPCEHGTRDEVEEVAS
jgi:hypothetical protein